MFGDNFFSFPFFFPGYKIDARAVYNFTATRTDELSFQTGDIIRVLNQEEDDWWQGQLRDKIGWFPSNHCVIIKSSESRPNSYVEPGSTAVRGRIYLKLISYFLTMCMIFDFFLTLTVYFLFLSFSYILNNIENI